MLRRLLAVLAVVILGSIAAQELLKTLASIAPLLICLVAALAIGGGWVTKKRKF